MSKINFCYNTKPAVTANFLILNWYIGSNSQRAVASVVETNIWQQTAAILNLITSLDTREHFTSLQRIAIAYSSWNRVKWEQVIYKLVIFSKLSNIRYGHEFDGWPIFLQICFFFCPFFSLSRVGLALYLFFCMWYKFRFV